MYISLKCNKHREKSHINLFKFKKYFSELQFNTKIGQILYLYDNSSLNICWLTTFFWLSFKSIFIDLVFPWYLSKETFIFSKQEKQLLSLFGSCQNLSMSIGFPEEVRPLKIFENFKKILFKKIYFSCIVTIRILMYSSWVLTSVIARIVLFRHDLNCSSYFSFSVLKWLIYFSSNSNEKHLIC